VSWQLRFLQGPEPWWGEFIDGKAHPQIGDCWYYPHWEDEQTREHFLQYQASRQYLEQWADKRPPVVVRLPPGFGFSPDERYYGGHWGDNPQREGWTVTGSLDDLSLVVQPSVNIIGTYHGWIQSGQVSDDVEGRTFG
jgi:hypothetical protein